MCNGWTGPTKKSLMNFMIYCDGHFIFYRSFDISFEFKEYKSSMKHMKEVVEWVRKENVVQIVTDNGPNYKKAGERLCKQPIYHFVWTGCAAHSILILKEFCRRQSVLTVSKQGRHVYNHSQELSIMRKCSGGDIICPTLTRFATNFVALQSMYNKRARLKAMIDDPKWVPILAQKKDVKMYMVEDLINDHWCWDNVKCIVDCLEPLVETLRLVDGDQKPTMRFLHKWMEMVYEKASTSRRYPSVLLNIINRRWTKQLSHDLHKAAYYLNPAIQYGPNKQNVAMNEVLLDAVKNTIMKLIPDVDSQVDAMEGVLEWKLDKLLEKNEREQNRYSELIYLCGKIQNVQLALQVFTLMEAGGVRPTCSIFNSLISTCLSSDNVITALSLFEIMQRSENCKPNSATYTAFISIYSKLGDAAGMQVWYTASKMAGFPPTVQTFEHLISGSIRSREIENADKFYEEMLLSGITPSMSILENMLEGLCQQKKLSKIKEFLKFIQEGGWNINEQMVNKLLLIYSVTGRVDEMEELLLVMRTNQDPRVLSQVHCGIIKMYALSDRLDDLEFSVGRMLKQGISFTCADDVEKAISSYFRCGAYERLDLFLERIHGSHKLTRATYDLLVAGYRRAGLSDRLNLVVKEMTLGVR